MAKADAREQVMGDTNDEASDSNGDVADQGEVGNDNQHDDMVMVVSVAVCTVAIHTRLPR